MATVIPVSGELEQIEPPKGKLGVDLLVTAGDPCLPPGHTYRRGVWVAPDVERGGDVFGGDVFVFHNPSWLPFNPRWTNVRATKFVSARGGSLSLCGTVVYLSQREWFEIEKADESKTQREGSIFDENAVMAAVLKSSEALAVASVPLHDPGKKSYPHRHKLLELGADWDREKKLWMVPPDKLTEATALLENGGPSEPRAKSKVPRRPMADSAANPGVFGSGPRRNEHPSACFKCGVMIASGAGAFTRDSNREGKSRWIVECLTDKAGCEVRDFLKDSSRA